MLAKQERKPQCALSSLSVASKPRNERVHIWIVYLWLAFQPILQVPMLEKSNSQFRDHLFSSSLTFLSFFWKWRFAFLGMWDIAFFIIVAKQAKGEKWLYGGSNHRTCACPHLPTIKVRPRKTSKATWGWSLILVSFWAILVHLGPELVSIG